MLHSIFSFLFLKNRRYFTWGLFCTFGAIILLSNDIGVRSFSNEIGINKRYFAITTGFILSLMFIWQWKIIIPRSASDTTRDKKELSRHRWIGSGVIILLFIHAASFGFAIRTYISITLILIVLSGLFHLQFFRKILPVPINLWRLLHIGLSSLALPLIFLHGWVAIIYKGPGQN